MTTPAAQRAAADKIMRMHEIRAVYGCHRVKLHDAILEALAQTRRAALVDGMRAVHAEKLEEEPQCEADEAYNTAIRHAVDALDRLASEEG